MSSPINRVSAIAATLFLSLASPLYGQSTDSPTPTISSVPTQETSLQDRKAVADRLFKEALEQYRSSQLQKALEMFQQVLAMRQEIGDLAGVGEVLYYLGRIYYDLSQYAQALEFYQQSFAIRQELGDQGGQGLTLNSIGAVYDAQSQYAQALKFYQQALAIQQQIGDKTGAGYSLTNIGRIYNFTGQYSQALEFYQQSLALRQEVGDRYGEGHTLNSIGEVYRQIGQYSQALKYYQQALETAQATKNLRSIGDLLNNIGLIYSELGQYSQALKFYQEALEIRLKLGDKPGKGTTLHNMGYAYDKLKQDSQALNFYQQALEVYQEIGDRAGVGRSLNNMGLVYERLKQYHKALKFLEESLTTRQEIGNKAGVGRTLDSIGTVYKSQGQYARSLEFYQQALALLREIGERPDERIVLSNIGDLLAQQNQPELAIVFYKLSVNVTESIRNDLRSLPIEKQRSYTETIANTYRNLVDLLLKQNRVLEAQQVLDLLKIQEIQDYLGSVRSNPETSQGVLLTPEEKQIQAQADEILNQEIKLAQELAGLEKIPPSNRTPQQEQRLQELRQKQREIIQKFNEFLNSPEIIALVQQLRQTGEQNLPLEQLNTLRLDILKRLSPKAVLLYPLILEDRLELVLITPDAPPINRSVAVKSEDFNRAIREFRTALENPRSDARVSALKLYNWLIKPIEKDLAQAGAKNIIYAPDGQLRYIPLAALYDGNQWLAQRFQINNITAMSLTKFTTRQMSQPQILAGAATGSYNFKLGPYNYRFSGLQYAGVEVENLAAMIPGTRKLLDREFSREAIIPHLNDYTIVHLATHASFVTGQPDDSFILLGDRSLITLRDIENWKLPNVDLVVLSACETGMGGKLGNGKEILGFGYQVQETGAKAAIASLWKVNDGGTQALMTAFYGALQSGTMTKAEALQRAKVSMITGDDSVLGGTQSRAIQERTRSNLPSAVASRLSHPYYWAPFILIGNGF